MFHYQPPHNQGGLWSLLNATASQDRYWTFHSNYKIRHKELNKQSIISVPGMSPELTLVVEDSRAVFTLELPQLTMLYHMIL